MTLQHLRHPTRRSAAVAIAALALLASAAQADTVTIDFEGFSPINPFISGSEDGFDLNATGGQIENVFRPVPHPTRVFSNAAGGQDATLAITPGSGLFTFDSLLALWNGASVINIGTLFVEGRLNGASQGTDTWTSGLSDDWTQRSASNLAGVSLDSLFITLDITAEASFISIDDIKLTPVQPVPLPAAAWLFGSALLGGVGLGYRNRKKSAA